MFTKIFKKIFGDANERLIKKYQKTVDKINALETDYQSKSDADLKGLTKSFKERLEKGEKLDDLLPEAFALVREASKRTLGLRHYDVQLIGGMVLHSGSIAEMKTGEGKTLVATLPVYLNALSGKGVHVVTVNDYLASRDAKWMGKIYEFLGLSVGCIVHGLSDEERKAAYDSDITYATNNELGFDYLRDNMKFRIEDMVQRSFNYAIVDEVDSILIDEARTPLIISGPTEESSDQYLVANEIVKHMKPEHYEKDEKQNNVTLTEPGVEKIEEILRKTNILDEEASLYDAQHIGLVHHINQALKANTLFTRDKDYIVKDLKVIIIDEFTGRMMEGRRFSEGLHQALEAKEGVPIQMENQTLASITYQNFFRLYNKLSGMTGTAMTEATEFLEIYKLDVLVLPTHKPCIRQDHNDEIYRTESEKFDAILELIGECRARKQPVLVGTASIEKSEKISELLKKKKVPHKVLNARYHEKEASIIAEAGIPSAVTIATNMAGRGTDIKLGGSLETRIDVELEKITNPAQRETAHKKIEDEISANAEIVKNGGGLYIIGTERHESRRIDNQLRGRAGRQADPGSSKFFLSLEDDLMRVFGNTEKLNSLLQKSMETGEAITHPIINRAIEKAQSKVEARNYDIRKHLLKYDDVMNDQRKVIYEQRRDVMVSDDVFSTVEEMLLDTLDHIVSNGIPEKAYPDQWNTDLLHEEVLRIFGLDLPVQEWAKEEGIAEQEIKERILTAVKTHLNDKFQALKPEVRNLIEKSVLLRMIDQSWKDHLLTLDHIRQGINLRAYAQRDPLNEYKSEAFMHFESMLFKIKEDVTRILSTFNFDASFQEEEVVPKDQTMKAEQPAIDNSPAPSQEAVKSRQRSENVDPSNPSTWGRVSRNELCPCGSKKKYKHCHGLLNNS